MCNADLKERKRQLFQEMGLPESISFVALAEMLRDTRDKLSEAQDEKELMSLEISAKDRQISDKDRQIQDLIARLSKYEGGNVSELDTTSVENQSKLSEQKITPKIVATNNNSSAPPSKNPIGIRHTQSLRKKSDKKNREDNLDTKGQHMTFLPMGA